MAEPEEKIKIKYLRDVEKIQKFSMGDWIDLRAGEDVLLRKGEFHLIPLGVAIQLPEGYEALLTPRSSTFKHYGIIQTNSVGVIDESYNGDEDEWMMPVYATKDTSIPFNDRICQFRIIKHQPSIQVIESSHLGNNSRGGFGSTGRS